MSRLSGTRLLLIALVAGLIAAALGIFYLKQQEARLKAAYKPPVQQTVAVVVPKLDLGKAQVLSEANVAVRKIPVEFLPSNAIHAEQWAKLKGKTLASPVQKGRPLSWDAVTGQAVTRFSENVSLGKRARTIKVNKIDSFDGLLRPGDHIDLLGHFKAKDLGLGEQHDGMADNVVLPILEDVVVLAAGREDITGRKYDLYYDKSSIDGFNMSFSTITVQLGDHQLAKVELAEKSGELFAVLRHPKDTSLGSDPQPRDVSLLLQADPRETVDVVLDESGRPIGRVIGDNIVDAQGNIIGKVVDGKAVGFDGRPLGTIARGIAADDPALRIAEHADIVRDAQGNVIGRVVDGKVVDARGNIIGTVQDGRAVGLDGRELGTVQRNVALDANGIPVDMSQSAVGSRVATVEEVVRDAQGNIIGKVVGGKVVDAQGRVIGTVQNGQAVGLDGRSLGSVTQVARDGSGRIVGETAQVVRDAQGNIVGRVVDGKVIDAQGRVIGTVQDGVPVGADGRALGQLGTALLNERGEAVGELAEVVRDAQGNVIGRVVDGKVIDAQGRVIGTVKNGVAVSTDGRTLGRIDKVMLDEQGEIVGELSDVVRDAQGNVIGRLVDGKVVDAHGRVVGELRDGKVIDPATGRVIADGVVVSTEAAAAVARELAGQAEATRLQVNDFIDFIGGGTAKDGVLPVRRVRLE